MYRPIPVPHISLPEGLPGITSASPRTGETARPMRELAEVLLRGPNTPPAWSARRSRRSSYRNEARRSARRSHSAAAAHHQGGDYSAVDAVKADDDALYSAKLKTSTIAGKVQIGGLVRDRR